MSILAVPSNETPCILLAVCNAVVVAALPPIFNAVAVPVKLVATPDDGVPNAPSKLTNAPALPIFSPSAVSTPVPNVIVDCFPSSSVCKSV